MSRFRIPLPPPGPFRALAGLAFLVTAFALGFHLGGTGVAGPEARPEESTPEAAPTVWTCSMHPEVRQDKPGKCPKCFMELVPLEEDAGGAAGERVFTTTPAAAALMDLRVSPVERRFPEAGLRLVGKVALDETTVGRITAWVPGRIDRLFVDYTGVQVRQGDHLVELYSPSLITAQEELRRAATSLAGLREGSPEALRNAARATLDAAREKLRRWGLTEAQVRTAEQGGTVSDHLTIYAPASGTVIEKPGQEGMYVETGTPIYTIADLGKVWVVMEAYERDLPWIHYGQPVRFTAEALPGAVFEGKVAFVDPAVDPVTRTVRVRVNVPNADGRLKPDMFVRAAVTARVATGGRVMEPSLAGKWISPMHPEVVKDGPGKCDVCGMDLVPAEDLGYVALSSEAENAPLVIPASAPLVTGKRAVVYVRDPGAETPAFEGREVVLGPRAGGVFIVASGLEEGEQVVTNGAFKIDSAMAIQAKPGMMQMASEPPRAMAMGAPASLKAVLRNVFEAYLVVQERLAGDNWEGAKEGLARAEEALDTEEARPLAGLREPLAALRSADGLATGRKAFEPWSEAVEAAVREHGLSAGGPVYRLHCPMAFDFEGADWLQSDETVRNPYFGSEMFSCGTVEERLVEAHE